MGTATANTYSGAERRLVRRGPETPEKPEGNPLPGSVPDDGETDQAARDARRKVRREERESLEAWDRSCEKLPISVLESTAVALTREVETARRRLDNSDADKHPEHRAKLVANLATLDDRMTIAREMLGERLGLSDMSEAALKSREGEVIDLLQFAGNELNRLEVLRERPRWEETEARVQRYRNELAVLRMVLARKAQGK